MDTITAAERTVNRAYRRHSARTIASRVGVLVVTPLALWGLILTPIVIASQPPAQAPTAPVTVHPHQPEAEPACDSLIRWGERMMTAADYMSNAWERGDAWGEYVRTDNLTPLSEQYQAAVTECNGSVTGP